MKRFSLEIGAVVCASLFFVLSCTKTVDVSNTNSLSLESSADAIAADNFSTCKMRYIYQDYGGVKVTGRFSYNSAGKPVSLLYENNGTGNPNHYFYYDNQGRLKEWRKTYQGGSVIVEKHRYGYNASNRIVQDTATYTEGGKYVTVSTIQYDAEGRVIKETIKNTQNTGGSLQPTRYPTYTYDNRGNIGVLGWKASSYDYKVSALRNNPIFQFLMRNYSKNNPAPQAKYNSKGLPLSWNPTNDVFFNSNVTYQIVYDCQ